MTTDFETNLAFRRVCANKGCSPRNRRAENGERRRRSDTGGNVCITYAAVGPVGIVRHQLLDRSVWPPFSGVLPNRRIGFETRPHAVPGR